MTGVGYTVLDHGRANDPYGRVFVTKVSTLLRGVLGMEAQAGDMGPPRLLRA